MTCFLSKAPPPSPAVRELREEELQKLPNAGWCHSPEVRTQQRGTRWQRGVSALSHVPCGQPHVGTSLLADWVVHGSLPNCTGHTSGHPPSGCGALREFSLRGLALSCPPSLSGRQRVQSAPELTQDRRDRTATSMDEN